MKPKVSLVECSEYDPKRCFEAVRASVDFLGGISSVIGSGETVLVKPNLLSEAKPDEAVTTHPEVVRAVLKLVKSVAAKVVCGDSPSVWGDQRRADGVYEATGIAQVCRQESVELVYFNTPQIVGSFALTDWLSRCDRLINVPKFKTHGITVLTAAVKNLFGLVVGMHKMKLHRECLRPQDLGRVLLDLYELRRPDLNIVDGILSMEGEGPGSSGTPKRVNLIAASFDGVALDAVLAAIMGLKSTDVPTLLEAQKRGMPVNIGSFEILGTAVGDFVLSPFRLPKTTFLNKVPLWFVNFLKRFLNLRLNISSEVCQRCGLCQSTCPVGAITLKGDRMKIDERLCILCLCCQEVCPYKAVSLRKSVLLRLLGM